MRRLIRLVILAFVIVLASTGCESHQAKVDALQREYDTLGKQFRKDCNAEYLKVPPTLSPKCEDENKKVEDAWSRLQAGRAKQ